MNKYAVFAGEIWLVDVHASDEHEALIKVKAAYPNADRVELISVERS